MRIVDCDQSHLEAIRAILNEAILNSTALYESQPRTPEMMAAWFEVKREGKYPVIGLVSDSDGLMGFASFGAFRAWPGYRYTVEHSLYVATPFRGQGLGKRLLEAIIARARAEGYHALIGGIDSGNAASIALHLQFGFTLAGNLREVGFKFDRWLDLHFYQLILKEGKG